MITLEKIAKDIIYIAEYYSTFREDKKSVLSKYFSSTNTIGSTSDSAQSEQSTNLAKARKMTFKLPNIEPQKINFKICLPNSNCKIFFEEDSSFYIQNGDIKISFYDKSSGDQDLSSVIIGLRTILEELEGPEEISSWQKYNKLSYSKERSPKSDDYKEAEDLVVEDLITEVLTSEAKTLVGEVFADEALNAEAEALNAERGRKIQEKIAKINLDSETYKENLISIDAIENFLQRIEEFKEISSVLSQGKLMPICAQSEIIKLEECIAKPDRFSQNDAVTIAKKIEDSIAKNFFAVEIAVDKSFFRRDYTPYIKKIADNHNKEEPFAELRKPTADTAESSRKTTDEGRPPIVMLSGDESPKPSINLQQQTNSEKLKISSKVITTDI